MARCLAQLTILQPSERVTLRIMDNRQIYRETVTMDSSGRIVTTHTCVGAVPDSMTPEQYARRMVKQGWTLVKRRGQ
jgi:hypothetical protein